MWYSTTCGHSHLAGEQTCQSQSQAIAQDLEWGNLWPNDKIIDNGKNGEKMSCISHSSMVQVWWDNCIGLTQNGWEVASLQGSENLLYWNLFHLSCMIRYRLSYTLVEICLIFHGNLYWELLLH